ncbi:MAG: trypsin-like peptidase domain-containing protein [Candidatus Omnitrophica bacterium]|nr:trypsin-like peptidase domain-containing protein [Candidatus Omnitrophota bacterium]
MLKAFLNKRVSYTGSISLALLFTFSAPSYAQTSLIEGVVEVKTVYAKAMRTGRRVSFERSGCGIVLDRSGLIVTNTHIIAKAPHIVVTLKDGKKYPARTVFSDAHYDFSFLKIKSPRPLSPIAWADSSKVQPGEKVVAFGHASGGRQSVGQVTKVVVNKSGATELLEIDIHLRKGDSGGPVLDGHGKLLGLVMAATKTRGRGIAIASGKIRKQYLRYKKEMK